MKKQFSLSQLNWPRTLFLCLTPVIALIAVPLYLSKQDLPLGLWVFSLVYMALTSLAITGGYHRLFSHLSYEANPILKFLYLLLGAAAIQNSALIWCTDHRRHHKEVDTDLDPYSINKGFFFAHIGWMLLKEDPEFHGKYSPDLAKDKLVVLQHKYYLPIAFFMCFGVPTIVGAFYGYAWGGFLIGGLARVVFTSHCTFLINSACHFWGTQPYNDKNTAKDNFFMAFFTYGEGYHNFHHRFQSDYRNGTKWFDWDPTKWLIYGCSKIGWTSRLKKVSPVVIVEAKMEMDRLKLGQLGIPAEKISTIWLKVEEAKKNWKHLHEEYLKFKENMQHTSREKLDKLRFEMKLAKLQFKHTRLQWFYFVKKCKSRPSLGW